MWDVDVVYALSLCLSRKMQGVRAFAPVYLAGAYVSLDGRILLFGSGSLRQTANNLGWCRLAVLLHRIARTSRDCRCYRICLCQKTFLVLQIKLFLDSIHLIKLLPSEELYADGLVFVVEACESLLHYFVLTPHMSVGCCL